MRATTQFPEATKRERIAVNTKELQAMLGCGRKTAVDIGEQAGAKIQIGRRVLWNPIVVKEQVWCAIILHIDRLHQRCAKVGLHYAKN